MPVFYISKDGLKELLGRLFDRGELFWVDASGDGNPSLARAAREEIPNYELPTRRGAEPIKGLIFPPKQKVAEYPDGPERRLELAPVKRTIFGIAQCDLAGIHIFDRVFADDPEFVDPFYISRREGLFIVTIDCTEIYPSCFCNLVKGKPYPESGFDLNLTPVEGGYIVETGSEQGEEALKGTGASRPSESVLKCRDEIRAEMIEKLERQNAPFKTEQGFIKLVTENQEEPKSYVHHASTCVGCGACTHICPGCFCFGIYDNPGDEGKFERLTTWDSCQFTGFSRMAGMLNPRLRMAQRFMHRYNHKFFHYPWRYDGWPACTGCGRCIDNCMGRIDMRATLRDLSVEDVSGMFPAPSPTAGKEPVREPDGVEYRR